MKKITDDLIKKNHDKEIIQSVFEDFENRRKERLFLEKIWKLNLNYLQGNQYCEVDMLGEVREEEKYYGWQTFYKKKSELSKVLAKNVQEGISNNISRENNRKELPIDNIKLIDKCEIPAIIVECGFLSNTEESSRLQTDEYQRKLCCVIASVCSTYLNSCAEVS